MIEVEGLAKRFGEVTALEEVSFRAETGEVLGFLGPNGAGKTTTLRVLTTYLRADSGRACVAGFDVSAERHEVRRRIGYLPESPPLDVDHTVCEYLAFWSGSRGLAGSRRREAVGETIERCGLSGVRDRRIGNLSRGFRQRVGIAQAIVHDPEVLILDEPTTGLDPVQVVEIRSLLRSLAGRRTVLLSTHILPEVAALCDRAVIVHRGRVVAAGTVAALSGSGGLEAAFLRATTEEMP